MIAVIFEAQPRPGRKQAYLDAAERLRPLLAKIDGFISIERFESLAPRGKRVAQVIRAWTVAPLRRAVGGRLHSRVS